MPSLNSRWLLVAFTMLAYLAVAAIHLAAYNFDVSGLIVAGDRFVSAKDLTHPIVVEPHSDGYDGQFYYRLALDPLTHKQTDHGITLDDPPIRMQRILYPLTAWAVSLGQGAPVPYALFILNLLAIGGLSFAATKLASHFSVPEVFGLLLPLYPGLILSMLRDTGEIFAAFFAVCCLLAAAKEKYLAAALLASAATLSRESSLFYLSGFGIITLIHCIRNRRFSPTPFYFLIPLIVYLAWQLLLRHMWGAVPTGSLGANDLNVVPLVDYVKWIYRYATEAIAPPIKYRLIFSFLAASSIAFFLVFIARAAIRKRVLVGAYGIAWLFYAALMAFFSDAIWNEPYGFLRILCDFYLLGVVLLIVGRDTQALRKLVPFVSAMWVATSIYALL